MSIIQDYGGDTPAAWNAFIAKLASLPADVKVLGITDYLFCDGYEYLQTRRDEFPNIELLIPNIEFRLNTFSGTENNTKRHNYHVLFDPDEVSIQDIREQLLNCLSTGYKVEDGSEWRQTPTPRSLAELGRQVKAAAPPGNSLHAKSDLQVGFDNITYSLDDIERLLQKTPFAGRFLSAIGYSEWDQSRWDQSAAQKRDLLTRAQFCLTSSDDPQKIEEHCEDLRNNNLRDIVLHSSDAHSLTRVGETLLWIKADPTFAGLKQVLNEPETRKFIGATPPSLKPDHAVISRISVSQSNNWFAPDFTLDLNRDLVAIIGGRGSGKSALAEAIAYGAGSEDRTDDAFLKKAAKHEEPVLGTRIQLEWADGSSSGYSVGNLAGDQGLVRYLPQGAVEELCSHRNSALLQKQIENVIYQYLDEDERQGASDFAELKARVLRGFAYEKDEVVSGIKEANRQFETVAGVISGLPEKKKVLKEKKDERARLRKGLPELPEEDRKGQEELASLEGLKEKFEAAIVERQTKLHNIGDLEAAVKVFKTRIETYRKEIEPILAALELRDSPVFAIAMDEKGIQRALTALRDELNSQILSLRTGSRNNAAQLLALEEGELTFDNLVALKSAMQEREKTTRAFESTKLKYQQQKRAISTLDNAIKALDAEILRISREAPPEKSRLEQERIDKYCRYFELLKEEKQQIEILYKPLQEALLSGTETDRKLVFEAKIDFNLQAHANSGLKVIDRTRKGNFRDATRLTSALEELLDQYVRGDFDSTTLRTALADLRSKFAVVGTESIAIVDQLRDGFTAEDFDNWFYDPTAFGVVSSLKFDGTDLYMLSPGQKGIILMMLYLEIDRDDYRPLIIDQPEANLDNLSVYRDLINYFRKQKRHRQIIIVTHNPNLVVNTDAEQVVVADYSGRRIPRLVYTSGSLENQASQIPNTPVEQLESGIIEQVCDILEGGESAFDKRKKKYQLSRKSRK